MSTSMPRNPRHDHCIVGAVPSAMLLVVMVLMGPAPASAAEAVHQLPQIPVPSHLWVAGKDFKLRPIVAKDPGGHTVNAPAFVMDIHTGTGDWDAPDSATIPAVEVSLPGSIQDRLALYYNPGRGWIFVPRGWNLIRAAEGADGNLVFDFVAPGGTSSKPPGAAGWLSMEVVGACLGCMYDAADGIIPGAHAAFERDILQDGSPEPKLQPTPSSMQHPDACTAVFAYQANGSPPVHAVLWMGYDKNPVESDPGEASLYLALPDSQADLAKFILDEFRHTLTSCGHGP